MRPIRIRVIDKFLPPSVPLPFHVVCLLPTMFHCYRCSVALRQVFPFHLIAYFVNIEVIVFNT